MDTQNNYELFGLNQDFQLEDDFNISLEKEKVKKSDVFLLVGVDTEFTISEALTLQLTCEFTYKDKKLKFSIIIANSNYKDLIESTAFYKNKPENLFIFYGLD